MGAHIYVPIDVGIYARYKITRIKVKSRDDKMEKEKRTGRLAVLTSVEVEGKRIRRDRDPERFAKVVEKYDIPEQIVVFP